ncbi:AraC family transcriptional regulator [Rhizosphaericola mali]|uniref:Helix-turn-helix transcriptional regulator n=1 Tax=Rhizosphaericola mali TaxID=2545455 RepID=A0A5P2FYZ9_9BACT|nr:helix-turn-helix domain-containing protein [Rhizosphaericola mali]QES88435.1 helix-turn-helix transcriptional regulator [Rhizosphaericola mali]
MENSESLWQYYQRTKKQIPEDFLASRGTTSHFNVMQRFSCTGSLPFQRIDYYKICLIKNAALLHTESKTVAINTPSIVFSSPEKKYGWESLGDEQIGFICLFNDAYLSAELKASLKKLYSLFQNSVYPLITLSEEEYAIFNQYFQRLEDEYTSDFEYKTEGIYYLLKLIIYQGIKTQINHCPKVKSTSNINPIVSKFMQLLDGQFPVDSPLNELKYKSASEFAEALHVHVNHLNHTLKTITGKSTTQIINEKITAEAIDLLSNTDWSITEIGNSLGFEYLQHFTLFIKKQTGKNPKSFRSVVV